MEKATLSKVLRLKEQIRQEQQKYLKAIEEGKEFSEAKEIMRTMTALQLELDKLMTAKKDGYHGF